MIDGLPSMTNNLITTLKAVDVYFKKCIQMMPLHRERRDAIYANVGLQLVYSLETSFTLFSAFGLLVNELEES